MKLVHISDIHLTCPGGRMGGLDPHLRFAQALDEVRAKHADADRIIITGDLTHWESRRPMSRSKTRWSICLARSDC
ncbi:MAG: metallophosphoesterase [Pseudomonadota bacterium]